MSDSASSLRQLKDALERDLAEQLTVAEPDWLRIESNSDRLTLLKVSGTHLLPRARPPWVVPLALALVSASVIAEASMVRPASARLELDATVTAFALTIGSAAQTFGGGLNVRAGSVKANNSGRSIAIEFLRQVTSIDQVRLAPGTELRFTALGDGCQQIRVIRGALGAQLTSSSAKDGEMLVGADAITLEGDGKLEFCTARKSTLYLTSPRSLDVSTVLNESERPVWYGPSIARGEIRFPAAGSANALRDTDRLRLSDIGPSQMALELSTDQRLMFAGDVGMAISYGFDGPQVNAGTNLKPTALTIARSSPDLLKFFAAVSGLSGILLGARRWLSAKEPLAPHRCSAESACCWPSPAPARHRPIFARFF